MLCDLPYLKLAVVALVATLFLAAYLLAGSTHKSWAVNEVPVSFWAWKTSTPSDEVVRSVQKRSGMNVLFLRAGQFDLKAGEVTRIRTVSGQVPKAVEVHFVYNATRELLKDIESVEPEKLAAAVAATYLSDIEKHASRGAKIVGVQLDLDYPTRLLPRYAEAVHELRKQLPLGTVLSVTGLPTWMSSQEVSLLLNNVDFWIPQLYGSEIPTRIDSAARISSLRDIYRSVIGARKLGKPFFAGLAAYGYAIHYDMNGELVEVRGDIDPQAALDHDSLEFVRQEDLGGNLRLVLRATSDLVLDGLVIAKGESLVFDIPTTDSLREAARIVREEAGDHLRGICIFRLPTVEDQTTLRLGEIVDALQDKRLVSSTEISITRVSDQQVRFTAVNAGSTSSFMVGALTIDLRVPVGSVKGVAAIDGFTGFETLCGSDADVPRKCSTARANVIRLTKNSRRPGDTPSISLRVALQQTEITAIVTTRTENGRIERIQKRIAIEEQRQ
ncbi:MAG TPA: DUF3142 domain-containing protein [Pyrinomonadaceae bacterium]|nr:DUF3142 domain-containing protein [Pyrinomonadaceae bacterium]